MSDCIVRFFETWEIEDDAERIAMIKKTVTDMVIYDDPRTTETIHGPASLNKYVGMFSKNAPGWSAGVVECDTIAGFTRVTVAFGGIGPDGNEMVQLGQYFVEKKDDKISRMIGFVGTGEPG